MHVIGSPGRRREGLAGHGGRVRQRLAAFAVVLAAAVGACSSGAVAPGSPATPSALVWPLTGLPAPDGVRPGPVLAVKVDNTASATPQIGVDAADVVVEELVEGGLTRLAVLLHSKLPDRIGPVRSMRTSDLGIVAPTRGVLVASGGAGVVVAELERAGLALATEGTDGFSRDRARRAPYNVMVDPAQLLAAVGTSASAAPPPSYLSRVAADASQSPPANSSASAGTAPATLTRLELSFSGATRVTWEWSGSQWRRLDDRAQPPWQPDVLLVLRITLADAGYVDPAGNPVPETVTEGSGDGLLIHQDRALQVRWDKSGPAEPWRLTAGGVPVPVPAGRVYVALVPVGEQVTIR